MATEIDYGKYLEAEPTPLMEHIEQWIKDKTGWDPSQARTKEEAFQIGVYLTVHLRGIHQASPENQARLAENRRRAEAEDAERAKRRSEREALGAKPRGRLPKAKEEPVAETPAPKRRGRGKAAASTEEAATATETPKRRGRPRKPEVATEAPAADNVTPMTPRRRRAAASAAGAGGVADVPAAEPAKPVRRRARRGGEAAF